MIEQTIKSIELNNSFPKMSISDAMKMLTVCWEDLIEETVKKCFAKSRISPKEQANAQNDLKDLLIELRSNIEKLNFLGVDEITEKLTPDEFANFNDTVAVTEAILSDEFILAMVRKVKEPVVVESDKEDGNDTTEVKDK